MNPSKEKEQLLGLKVMRLTKPSLMPFHPSYSEPDDLMSGVWNDLDKTNIVCPPHLELFGLSNLLTLPQHFGNIFLGEIFSSYISVHNRSDQICSDVVIKSDLQTTSQRLPITGLMNPSLASLPPNSSVDDVIHYEVKELGTHILVCAVSYINQSGEKMSFRKFFKFQVLKPLDIKTKFINSRNCDRVFLEAQIQNITPSAIYMDRVTLHPSSHFSEVQINTVNDSDDKVFGSSNYITPMDVQQYLYALTPTCSDFKILKDVKDIGKLDILWRTNMGEKGRLQTSQLQRVTPDHGDIRLTITLCPDVVSLEASFNISCRVTNCCERVMELTLHLKNNFASGTVWCGVSGKPLGKLYPNTSADVNLSLIATIPGLQTISGLRLTDTFLKRTYEHDDIARVFVSAEL